MTEHKDIWILHIETSTKACSVALSKNDKCVKYKEFLGQNFSHAEKLPVFIDELIKESEIEQDQLSAISISSGPGSYTGLRIGCSTAKGLSFALGIPLISVDTLQISTRATQLKENQKFYISVMKARLNEVFVAVYDNNGVVKPTHYINLTEGDLNVFSDESVMIVGNAVELVKNYYEGNTWTYHDVDNAYQAKDMVALAYHKYVTNEFEDLAYYEPFYLKDFVVLKKKSK